MRSERKCLRKEKIRRTEGWEEISVLLLLLLLAGLT